MKNPIVLAAPTAGVFLLRYGLEYLAVNGYVASRLVVPFCFTWLGGLLCLKGWLMAPLYALIAAPAVFPSFFVTFGVVGVRRWRSNANDRHER